MAQSAVACVGELVGIPGFWLQPSPAPDVAFIWGANQWRELLSL